MRRLFAGSVQTLAILASVAVLVSGCSPEVGYPAVHDMPAPRADTPLTPDQVKQATDDLITQREQLSTATQASGQQSPATNGKTTSEARKKPSPPAQPAAQATDPSATQTAGAAAKP